MVSDNFTQQAMVYDQLRDLIMSGHFEPRTRLSERKLCEELDATRGPVRESLIRLEGEGLVRKTPAHAYYVEDFSREDKEDIYAVRMALERVAVRKAVENATLEDKIRLTVICEEEQRAFDADDETVRLRHDQMFHEKLVHASGSKVLRRIFDLVTLPVLPAAVVDRTQIRKTVTEHAAICQAIKDGDADEAERLVEEHLSPGLRFAS